MAGRIYAACKRDPLGNRRSPCNLKMRTTFNIRMAHSYRLQTPSAGRLRRVVCDPSMLRGECNDAEVWDKEFSSKVVDVEHTGGRAGSLRKSNRLKGLK